MSTTPPRAIIIAAIRDELNAVAKALPASELARVNLVRGGVGPQSATRTMAGLSLSGSRFVCSTGFCGGLRDGLAVGDIVVATEILCSGIAGQIAVAPELLEQLTAALRRGGIRFHTGAVVSVNGPVFRCDHKRALGLSANAVAVDMESFAITTPAAQAGVTPLVLRVVSDAVDDELPSEVSGFLDDDGNVRAGKITRFILKRPTNISRLMELKKRSDTAAAALTAAWKAVAPVFLND